VEVNDISSCLKCVLLPPTYGSMEGYLVYCAFVIFCTVTDFSAAEKAKGVCMRVGLLYGQVFSPLVNIGSRGVTGAAA